MTEQLPISENLVSQVKQEIIGFIKRGFRSTLIINGFGQKDGEISFLFSDYELEYIYSITSWRIKISEYQARESGNHIEVILYSNNENCIGLLDGVMCWDYPFIKGQMEIEDASTEIVANISINWLICSPGEYYKRYLKSEKWRLLKQKLFRERGFNCELCKSQRNLHVHHITYERLGKEEDDDVMILCEGCHKKAHKK